MRSSLTSRCKSALSAFFAATLVLGLIPSAALAVEDNGASAPKSAESANADSLDPVSEESETNDLSVPDQLVISDDAAPVISSDSEKSDPDPFSVGAEPAPRDGEDATEDNAQVSGDGDSAITIPAATERINEDVMLTTPVAQQETTRNYFLAQTLESTRTIPIVSANLPLDKGSTDVDIVVEPEAEGSSISEEEDGESSDDDSDPEGLEPVDASFTLASYENDSAISAESTVIGSFTYRGITYAVEPGGETVAIVAADYTKLPEDFIEAKAIVLPSMVTPDAIDYYTVTRIADYAFSNLNSNEAGIDAITVPATVTEIGDNAYADFNTLQYILVSDDNPNYSQYDGCLYTADQSRLLLIPEGRLGAVRVAPSVTEVDPEVFSHCSSVQTLITDPASAAHQLLQGMDIDKELSIELDNHTDTFVCNNLGGIECSSENELASIMASIGENDSEAKVLLSGEVLSLLEGVPTETLLRDDPSFTTASVTISSGNETATAMEARATSNSVATSTYTGLSSSLPKWIRNVLSGLVGSPTITLYDAKDETQNVNVDDTKTYGMFTLSQDRYSYPDKSAKGKTVGTSMDTVRKTVTWHCGADYPGFAYNYLIYQLRYSTEYGLYIYLNRSSDSYNTYHRPLLSVSSKDATTGTIKKSTVAVKLVYSSATLPFAGMTSSRACTTWYMLLQPELKVNWNTNGGTCSTSSWLVPTKTWDSNGEIPLSNYSTTFPTPTRDNYNFDGWYTAASGGTKISSSTTFATEGTTYYAHWTPVPYTITCNPNGGKIDNSTSNWTKGYNIESDTITLPTPTRDRYTFDGWTGANGTAPQKTVTVAKGSIGDKIYTANWSLAQWTVTIDGGDGSITGNDGTSGASITVDAKPSAGDTSVYGTANACRIHLRKKGVTDSSYTTYTASRTGYTQTGWKDSNNRTIGTTTSNAEALHPAGDGYKVTATWIANTYTLTLDKQGGSGGADSTGVEYGKAFASKIDIPSRDRYNFAGYFTDKDGKGTQYFKADGNPTTNTWNTDGDGTLYAHWTLAQWTITIDAAGGTVWTGATSLGGSYAHDTVPISGYTTAYGSGNWFALDSTNKGGAGGTRFSVSRPGYTQTQWTCSNGQSVGTTTDTSGIHPTGDYQTFTATWTPNTYALTVNPSGGTISGLAAGKSVTFTMTYDTANNYRINNAFTKTGHTFAGLWTSATGGTQVYAANGYCINNSTWFNDKNFWKYTDNLTVYAHWDAIEYGIEWQMHGHGTAPTKMSYAYGESYTLPKVSQAGYTFDGWYMGADYAEEASDITPTTLGKKTFHAKWTANDYTVTFDANGGSGGLDEQTMPVTYDDPLPELVGDWKPVNPGFSFGGWYCTELVFNAEKNGWDEIETAYYTDEGVAIPKKWDVDHDVTLKAKWNKVPAKPVYLVDDRLKQGTQTIYYWEGRGYVTGKDSYQVKKPGQSIATELYVDDYRFLGWYDRPEGDEDASLMVASIGTLQAESAPQGDAIWYAHWERLGAPVELKADYGDMVSEDIDPGTEEMKHVAFGEDFAKPLGTNTARIEKIDAPTRTGYTFMGYYTEENPELSTEDVKNGDIKGKLWIYGEGVEGGRAGDLIKETWPDEKYWQEEFGLTDEEPTNTIVLYAAWQLDDCIVTFDAETVFDEEGNVKGSIEEVFVPEGSTALDDRIWHYNKNMDETLPVPGTGTFSRNGYVFGGWYLLEDDGTKVRVSDAEGTPENILLPWTRDVEGVTLYAYWTPRSYILQLDPNFPNVEGVEKVYEGETQVKLAYDDALTLVAPDFGAYDFAGWYVYAGTDETQTVLYGDSLEDIHMTDGRFTPRSDLAAQFDPATIKIVAKWDDPVQRTFTLYVGKPGGGEDALLRRDDPEPYYFAEPYAFDETWAPGRVAGWEFEGWVEVGSDDATDEEKVKAALDAIERGDTFEGIGGATKIEPKVTRASYRNLHYVAKWTICPMSVTLASTENEEGSYVRATDAMDGTVKEGTSLSWNDVATEEGSYKAVYDVRDKSFTLPDLTRKGYDFKGWRKQGGDGHVWPRVTVDPAEQAKDKTDYHRVYEPVFEVITYTIILKANNTDPNTGKLQETGDLKDRAFPRTYEQEFTFPYPVALNTGGVFSAWATKSKRPSSSSKETDYREFFQAKTYPMSPGTDENGKPTFCLSDLTTDEERTIVLYAIYNGSYNVTVPLVANMAIDTETGDVVAGKTTLWNDKEDVTYNVESLRYEPVKDVATGQVPFQGAYEVYFSIYPGLSFQNDADAYYFLQKSKVGEKGSVTYADKEKDGEDTTVEPILVKLGGTDATPKLFTRTSLSDDPDEVTLDSMTGDTYGFYSFGKNKPLDVYYGIHFADSATWKDTLKRFSFKENGETWALPKNDAGNQTDTTNGRKLGWSSDRVDIAKVRYTLSMTKTAQDETTNQ